MAETVDLIAALRDHHPTGVFTPYAYYGAEEDALTVYISDKPDYARRLGERVTVFFARDNDELVGCQIKSVRHVLEDIGTHDMAIKDGDGKVRLRLLFKMFYGRFENDPRGREAFRHLDRSVTENDISIDVPEMCSC